jgi:hypothetical protein
MATYRAYLLDSANSVIERREIEAQTDQEAVQIARQWIDGLAIEVWCGSTLVETIQPIHTQKLR